MPSKHILVVEDEEMTARLIVYRLNALGHKVEHKKDGIEGLKYILSEKPEVLVLDVMLPGMSGFEILEKLQNSGEIEFSDLKVIMLSTKKRTEDISRGFNLGALEYVPKPFKMDEFLLRLNRIINQ